jgi:YidC/Oxa1 family membrane protein insertase
VHLLLASSWLDPFVNALTWVIDTIYHYVGDAAWSLVLLAALIRLAMWPLNTAQFKSMIGMQKLAPKIKALQERYGKSDPQRMQRETMALYKEHGVNPLSGCLPLLVQMPILFSVYYAVQQPSHKPLFAAAHWMWIGSPLSVQFPNIFAANLGAPDVALLVLYAVSLYVSMRYTTMPPTDPAQANQMKLMQILSPLMFSFFAFRAKWPSAMVLYWFAFNVFTMGQQFYLLRRYHQPFKAIDSEHAITEDVPARDALPSSNGETMRGPSKKKRRRGAKG